MAFGWLFNVSWDGCARGMAKPTAEREVMWAREVFGLLNSESLLQLGVKLPITLMRWVLFAGKLTIVKGKMAATGCRSHLSQTSQMLALRDNNNMEVRP